MTTKRKSDLALKQRHRQDQVAVRLGLRELERIDVLISAGAYMNRADFVRSATREKLEAVEVLEIRDLDRSQARKEIVEYLGKNGKSYASDVAEFLRLDLGLVFSILEEIRKKGVVE